jgi:hypothetical protein
MVEKYAHCKRLEKGENGRFSFTGTKVKKQMFHLREK